MFQIISSDFYLDSAHVNAAIVKTLLPFRWSCFAVASQSRPLLKSLRSPRPDPHREQDPGPGPSLTHRCSSLWQDKPETILSLRKKLLQTTSRDKEQKQTSLQKSEATFSDSNISDQFCLWSS